MKFRVCYCLCAIIMIISAFIVFYDWLVLMPLRAQTYVISPLEIICSYMAKPAFWLCSGIVLALSLFRLQGVQRFQKVCLWSGIAIVAIYFGLSGFYLMEIGVFAKHSAFPLRWLLKNTFIFLIPGILIGSGIDKNTP